MGLEKSMRRHVEKWKESGVSKREYAKRAGMGVHKYSDSTFLRLLARIYTFTPQQIQNLHV